MGLFDSGEKDLNNIDSNKDSKLSSKEIDRFMREFLGTRGLSIDEFFENNHDTMVWDKRDKESKKRVIMEKLATKTDEEKQEYLSALMKFEQQEKVELLIGFIKESLGQLKKEIIASNPGYKQSEQLNPNQEPISKVDKKPSKSDTKAKKHEAEISYKEVKYDNTEKEKKNDINDPLVVYLLESFPASQRKEVFEKCIEDINIISAIKVLEDNPGKTFSDLGFEETKKVWRESGYKYDGWVFGPTEVRSLDSFAKLYSKGQNSELIHKTKKLHYMDKQGYNIKAAMQAGVELKKPGAKDKLFNIICDYNMDGSVDKKDAGNVTGMQLLDIMNQIEGRIDPRRFYGNIAKVLEGGGLTTAGMDLSKEGLFRYMQQYPEAKEVLRRELERRASGGQENIKYILEDGSLKKSMDVRSNIEASLGESKLMKDFKIGIESALNKSVSELKTESGKIKDPKAKMEVDKVIAFLEDQKHRPSLIESMRVQAVAGALKMIENHEGGSLGVSVTNDRINDALKEVSGDIIKSLSITAGLNYNHASGGGSLIPGVGLNVTYGGKLGKRLEWFGAAGFVLFIPYGSIGIQGMINEGEIERTGLKEFDTPKRKVGAMVAGSLTGNPVIPWGFTAFYNQDRIGGIDHKKEEFKNFMNSIFKINIFGKSTKQIVDELRVNMNKENLIPEDKKYVDVILGNIEKGLLVNDFDKLTENQKVAYLVGMKDSFVKQWQQKMFEAQAEKGYRFGGIGLGLAFIAGFFPLPVIGIKFDKVTTRYVEDKDSRMLSSLNLYYGAGQEKKNLGGTINDFAKGIKEQYLKNVDVDVSVDNGRIKFTSMSNKDILEILNVYSVKGLDNQIQYDGKSLLVGNVGMISLFEERKAKTKKYYIILGSNKVEGTEKLGLGDKTFLTNKPDPINFKAGIAPESGDNFALQSAEYINKNLEGYIKNNLDKIVGLPQRSPKHYMDFKKNMNSRFYESALVSLLSLITSDSKLKSDMGSVVSEIKTLQTTLKGYLNQGKDIYRSNDPQIINTLNQAMYIASQFNSAMMTDWQTKDKLLSVSEREKMTKNYINQLYSRYPKLSVSREKLESSAMSVLKNPSNWQDFKSNYEKIDAEMQSIQNPPYPGIHDNPAKKLNYLVMPVGTLLSSRTNAFVKLSTENGLNGQQAKQYRDSVMNKFSNKASFEPLESDPSMLSFTASYKLNAANNGRLSWGFDTMPPGVVSIAGGANSTENVTDAATKNWIIKNIENSKYYQNMKGSIASILGVEIQDSQMHQLLVSDSVNIDGRNISLRKSYMFFLYGMCGNESFGVKFLGLDIDGRQLLGGFAFNADGSVVVQQTKADVSSIGFGFVGGKEKPTPARQVATLAPRPTTTPTPSPTPTSTVPPTTTPPPTEAPTTRPTDSPTQPPSGGDNASSTPTTVSSAPPSGSGTPSTSHGED